jgi:hypothetical protein
MAAAAAAAAAALVAVCSNSLPSSRPRFPPLGAHACYFFFPSSSFFFFTSLTCTVTQESSFSVISLFFADTFKSFFSFSFFFCSWATHGARVHQVVRRE